MKYLSIGEMSRVQSGLLVVLLLLFNSAVQASQTTRLPDCRQAANAFLAHPTQHTFITLVGADEARCWPAINSSVPNLQQLNQSVENGNRWAAKYLAMNLKRLDGGNLEDSLVALGQFSDHNMERLFIFAHEGRLTNHEFVNTLTMLPPSLGDNLQAQLDRLMIRRTKVMHVTQKDLLKQKVQALKAIDDFASEIKSHIP